MSTASPSRSALPRVLAVVTAVALVTGGILIYRSSLPPEPDAENSIAAPAPLDVNAAIQEARRGDTNAQLNLGKFYSVGQNGHPDYTNAVVWYKLAADQGNAEAQTAMGDLCSVGQGISQNAEAAITWYRKAASQGYAIAQYDLALAYQTGRGVPKDQKLAAKWHQLASQGGHAWAQFNLAQRYERGIGFEQDRVEALKWYRLAAKQNVDGAVAAAQALENSLSSEQISAAKAKVENFVPTVLTNSPVL